MSIDDVRRDLKFHRQVEHLYSLGSRPFGEALLELAGSTEALDRTLNYFDRWTPETARTLRGDTFPPPPIHKVPQ